MTYRTFQNKSKHKRDEIRKEFEEDTFDARLKANSDNIIYKYIYTSSGDLLKKNGMCV